MKRQFAIIILASFVLIAVFGFLGMFSESDLGYRGCLADTAQGASCPVNAGPIAMVNFHLATFLSFSSAVLAASLLLFAVLLIVSGAIETPSAGFLAVVPKLFYLKSNFYSQRVENLAWFSLHYNSPTNLSS